MKIRAFQKPDAEAAARGYRDAATKIGGTAYGADQVRVWALYPDDIEEFRARLSRGVTLVAEAEGVIVAFGQLEPTDHIAFLYCASEFARRGIATAIYLQLAAQARASGATALTTDAKRISRPFFERQGFVVSATESSLRLGVAFERFKMVKDS